MSVKYEWAECKGCGKKIIFAKTPEGKTVVLDPHPALYSVSASGDGLELKAVRVNGCKPNPEMFTGFEQGYAVSHFSTCPKASDFSHKK